MSGVKTNFNIAPYYDDFDKTKNFHRILFRPGFAVQARELTQMQSILQDQVSRFGDHIFKEGSKVFHGLSRRRSAELELFCHKPPEFKWGWVFITSKCHTSLKKRPLPDNELSSDEIAKISPKRLIRRCRVIERNKGYTYLEFGFGLGEWWVLDKHWVGLKTEVFKNTAVTAW